MRVVDTSIWIELALGSPLGRKAKNHFPSFEDSLVPTVVQYELWRWFRRMAGEAAAEAILARTALCNVVPLASHLAIAAAEIARRHKLAMADAIVYVTALAHDADVLTCDAHFKDLPRVVYFAKTDA